jgi:hypothetical protein
VFYVIPLLCPCSCLLLWHDWRYAVASLHTCRYGARMGGSKKNAVNLILRLFLYHILHTMSSWRHESIHNSTNNQQTLPPWWWSRLPLQRRGFNEYTPPKGQVALRIHFPRPLLEGLVKIIKLK